MIINYRRGPGQAYLKSTLSGVLLSVVEDKDLLLEINPSKVRNLSIYYLYLFGYRLSVFLLPSPFIYISLIVPSDTVFPFFSYDNPL